MGNSEAKANLLPERENSPAIEQTILRMKLVGANPQAKAIGEEKLPGKVNYFRGADPTQWSTNVPTYAKVHYQAVYPGVDLVYYGNQQQLEYDFVVAPGADPGSILLGFEGADYFEINAEGDLILQLADEQVRMQKPTIYQEVAGVRRAVVGGYVLKDQDQIGFHVGAYDATQLSICMR
jgi:hypothetical protein